MTLTTSMRRSGLLLLIGTVVACQFAAAPAAPVRPTARRHIPIQIRKRRNNIVTSTNWSGYAITGARGSVTDVKGSWIVPDAASCSSTNQYASFWIGIDGYNSNTVEQIGTDSDCQGGVAAYYAWYEFYPHWSYTIRLNAPILPGDRISAEVKATAGGVFTVSLTDTTTGQSFSTNVKMNNAQRSSAEWTAEAPWSGGVLPLTDFGIVQYGANYTGVTGTSAATVNGSTGSIGFFGSPTVPSSPVQEITMVTSNDTPKAQPSDLSKDGSSFSIQWLNSGP